MITRVLTKASGYGQNKTMWPKRTGHSNAIRLAIPGVDQMRYTADETWSAANKNRRQTELRQTAGWSDCQLTADTLRLQQHCAYQKGVLVQKRVPCRWAVSFPDENVFTTDGKGICRNSWRKWMRCPRRLRVPSLNKIAQAAVRPYSFMGISHSELFLGFYRCFAEWKSPLIRSFVPEPDHRHSAQRCRDVIDHRKSALLDARGYARQVGDDDPFKISDKANY